MPRVSSVGVVRYAGRMRSTPVLAFLLLAAAACGGSSTSTPGTAAPLSTVFGPTTPYKAGSSNASKLGDALVVTGLAVAAAGINRAVTGECWATCPTGMRCDKAAGTCVALPCGGRCPADAHCAVIEGKETCVHGARDVAAQGQEILPVKDEPRGAASATQGGAEDPCKGLCFSGEQCVEKGGVADCVPRAATPGSSR